MSKTFNNQLKSQKPPFNLKDIIKTYKDIKKVEFYDLPRVRICGAEDDYDDEYDEYDYDDDDYEYIEETVSFENVDLELVTENSVKITAGGDWQPPITFTAYLFSDGKLHVDPDSVEYKVYI